MKRLLLSTVAALLVVGTAHAQPPHELTANDSISLAINAPAKTFEFDQAVTQITLADDDIVKVVPRTDHVFEIHALNPGRVLMTAYAPDGHTTLIDVVVTQPGHLIKHYGLPDVVDYVSYYCTGTGCGRANPDVKEPAPSSQSVAVTRHLRNGDIVTNTKHYQH